MRRCDGTENIGEVIDAVEPRLWNMSTVLPILQDTTIVAAGPRVQNVSLTGAVPVGHRRRRGRLGQEAAVVRIEIGPLPGEGGRSFNVAVTDSRSPALLIGEQLPYASGLRSAATDRPLRG